VVVMTTSRAQQDVLQAYKQHANCYVTKPVDFEQFLNVVPAIQTVEGRIWRTIAVQVRDDNLADRVGAFGQRGGSDERA
jgi:CheY-like chemotaxis protein